MRKYGAGQEEVGQEIQLGTRCLQGIQRAVAPRQRAVSSRSETNSGLSPASSKHRIKEQINVSANEGLPS